MGLDYKDKDFIIAGEQANAFLCRPEVKALFPAVIFSHGRAIRDLQAFETAEELIGKHLCQKWASDGFLAFIPIRDFYLRDGPENIPYNLTELLHAVDYVKSLPDVDPSRVELMGHSRGGLLTLRRGWSARTSKGLSSQRLLKYPHIFPRDLHVLHLSTPQSCFWLK